MEEKTGKPGENLRSQVEIDWKPTYRRRTWGFPVLWCWCFFDAVMRWIKSQFAVLRWSQILRCRRFVFFTLRCWMKWNYLRCCGLLCDWVMRCSLIFFAVFRAPSCPPPTVKRAISSNMNGNYRWIYKGNRGSPVLSWGWWTNTAGLHSTEPKNPITTSLLATGEEQRCFSFLSCGNLVTCD